MNDQLKKLDQGKDPTAGEPVISDVTGVILAGGESSRFGSNKALAQLNGSMLIEKAASTLEHVFSKRLLVTNAKGMYEFLGWPEIEDVFAGAGPLAGIHAALKQVQTEKAFITACDMPFLDSGFIRYLCEIKGEWDIVLPWTESGPEPLFAVYSRGIVPLVEEKLVKKELKIRLLVNELRVRRVETDEIFSVARGGNIFHNVNWPEDMPEDR